MNIHFYVDIEILRFQMTLPSSSGMYTKALHCTIGHLNTWKDELGSKSAKLQPKVFNPFQLSDKFTMDKISILFECWEK